MEGLKKRTWVSLLCFKSVLWFDCKLLIMNTKSLLGADAVFVSFWDKVAMDVIHMCATFK